MSNLDKFMDTYEGYLCKEVMKNPGSYPWWPQTTVETVIGRMREAIVRNSFNKESNAIKNTCKALKIGWNYKSIQSFISADKGGG